jgi:hypothetical protein
MCTAKLAVSWAAILDEKLVMHKQHQILVMKVQKESM